MGQELYIFKLNQQRAKDQLTQTLSKKSASSYKKYLADSTYYQTLSFEDIVQKAATDIEQISIEELWSLFHWFYDEVEQENPAADYQEIENQFHQKMSENGLDLCYEIPSKTPVNNFFLTLGTYNGLNNSNLRYDYDAKELQQFLDYAVCLKGKIYKLLIEHYYHNDKSKLEDYSMMAYRLEVIAYDNPEAYALANQQFNHEKKYFLETIQEIVAFFKVNKRLSSYQVDSEYGQISRKESEIINSAAQFYYVCSFHDILMGYQGRVKMLHSY